MKRDIQNLEDIQTLVNQFYGTVRLDPLLGPIFIGAIRDRWPEHLEKMYRFWQTILLDEHTYSGSPFAPHADMPLEKDHFERWLRCWHETVRALFTGPLAEEAMWRAEKMAEILRCKIEFGRKSVGKFF